MLNPLMARVTAAIVLAVGLLALPATQATVEAQDAVGADPPPVWGDGENVGGELDAGRTREQVDTVNSGSSGTGGPPPTCTWSESVDGETVEHNNGTPRWRQPGRGSEFWEDDEWVTEGYDDEAVASGTVYRYECWHDDMVDPETGECRSPSPDTEGCLGEAIDETWCGRFLCVFDAINPEALALLALDDFLERIPPPDPQFNPPNETTIVNFDTWMWVEGVPEGRQIDLPPLNVLDDWIQTTARFEEVVWDMGDGSVFSCPLTTDEESARAEECTNYRYQQSSAGEGGDDRFHGSASIEWEVTYWGVLNGVEIEAQDTAFDELRQSPFSLEVAEGQAIVVDR